MKIQVLILILCVQNPKILNKWFEELFGWLEKCETVFELDKLEL